MRSRFHSSQTENDYNQIPTADNDNSEDNENDDDVNIPIWKQIFFFGILALVAFSVSFRVTNSNRNVNDLGGASSGAMPLRTHEALQIKALASSNWTMPKSNGNSTNSNQTATGNVKNEHKPSPYEKKFPSVDLPYWAHKQKPLTKEQESLIPQSEQVCFVHVGKAGGSTIGCVLGFSLHCSTNNQTAEGILPTLSTHVFHRGVNDCVNNNAYYLFVVRDPLARLKSAFYYERPIQRVEGLSSNDGSWLSRRQSLYFDCPFWTIDEFGRNGFNAEGFGSDGIDDLLKECPKIAYEAITGRRGYLVHWTYNYQFYLESIGLHNKDKVIVIRNEHMVQDWNGVEVLLGGQENIVTTENFPHDNSQNKNETELYISDESRVTLCRMLCNEIQAYKSILRLAKNLKDNELVQSMDELREVCPNEADLEEEEDCKDEIPDISAKIKRTKAALDDWPGTR